MGSVGFCSYLPTSATGSQRPHRLPVLVAAAHTEVPLRASCWVVGASFWRDVLCSKSGHRSGVLARVRSLFR